MFCVLRELDVGGLCVVCFLGVCFVVLGVLIIGGVVYYGFWLLDFADGLCVACVWLTAVFAGCVCASDACDLSFWLGLVLLF